MVPPKANAEHAFYAHVLQGDAASQRQPWDAGALFRCRTADQERVLDTLVVETIGSVGGWDTVEWRAFAAQEKRINAGVATFLGHHATVIDAAVAGDDVKAAALREAAAARAVAWLCDSPREDDLELSVPILLQMATPQQAPRRHQIYVGLRKHPDLPGQPVVLRIDDSFLASASDNRHARHRMLALSECDLTNTRVLDAIAHVLASPQRLSDLQRTWLQLTQAAGGGVPTPSCCASRIFSKQRAWEQNCCVKNANLGTAARLAHACRQSAQGLDTRAGKAQWVAYKAGMRAAAQRFTPSDIASTLGANETTAGGWFGAEAKPQRSDVRIRHTVELQKRLTAARDVAAVEKVCSWLTELQADYAKQPEKLLAAGDILKRAEAKLADLKQDQQAEKQIRTLASLQDQRCAVEAQAYKVCADPRDLIHATDAEITSYVRLALATIRDLRRQVTDATHLQQAQVGQYFESGENFSSVVGEGLIPCVSEFSGGIDWPHAWSSRQVPLTLNIEEDTGVFSIGGDGHTERYRFSRESVLGEGASAEVRLCVRESDGALCAAKMSFAGDGDTSVADLERTRDLFSNERRLAQMFPTPLAAGVFATTGEVDDVFRTVLLMPLSRASVDSMVNHARFCGISDGTILHMWLSDVVDDLRRMHEHPHKYTHRDIKLDNVLVSRCERGQFRFNLADYGLTASSSSPSLATNMLTNAPLHDLDFSVTCAPTRQAVRRLTEPASDIWRLGLMILESLVDKRAAGHDYLLTPIGFADDVPVDDHLLDRLADLQKAFELVRIGQEPLADDSVSDATLTLWREAWYRAHKLPWPLNKLVKNALSPDPSARPSAAAFAMALESFAPSAEHRALWQKVCDIKTLSIDEYAGRTVLAHELQEDLPTLSGKVLPTMIPSHAMDDDFLVKRYHPHLADVAADLIRDGKVEDLDVLLSSGLLAPNAMPKNKSLLEHAVNTRDSRVTAHLVQRGFTHGLDSARRLAQGTPHLRALQAPRVTPPTKSRIPDIEPPDDVDVGVVYQLLDLVQQRHHDERKAAEKEVQKLEAKTKKSLQDVCRAQTLLRLAEHRSAEPLAKANESLRKQVAALQHGRDSEWPPGVAVSAASSGVRPPRDPKNMLKVEALGVALWQTVVEGGSVAPDPNSFSSLDLPHDICLSLTKFAHGCAGSEPAELIEGCKKLCLDLLTKRLSPGDGG